MPDTTPTASPAAEEAIWRLEDIAGHLSVAGLRACLHHTRHSSYLTATARSGREEVEATFDDDSYCEIRFWVPASTAPGDVAAVIIRTMTAITSAG